MDSMIILTVNGEIVIKSYNSFKDICTGVKSYYYSIVNETVLDVDNIDTGNSWKLMPVWFCEENLLLNDDNINIKASNICGFEITGDIVVLKKLMIDNKTSYILGLSNEDIDIIRKFYSI